METDLIRGLTILIATYNASKLIEETLTRLITMEKVPDLPWEVLIVDNNSTDDTVEKARTIWKDYADLRIINELRQGTGYATFKGMSEAKYTFIAIVDQDNWVSHDWMVKAIGHMDSSPAAALICGKGKPIFESEEPAWFKRFPQNYAVGSQTETNGSANDPNKYFYNAASIMRKAAFDELLHLGFKPIMKSRSSHQLLSGEDTELQILMRLRGWEIHYQDDICFEHYMPMKRLSLEYFKGLREGLGASSVYLSLYRNALKAQTESISTLRVNWRKELLRSFINVISDPLAVVASLNSKYASNYRVAKYWSHLGEFRERLRLKSSFETTQTNLILWLDSINTQHYTAWTGLK